MGLMDILNGMQNGPRGQRQDAPSGSQSGSGLSPMMMALLGLLAYKAVKGGGLGNIFGGAAPERAPAPLPGGTASPTDAAPSPGGSTLARDAGLGNILGGLFGGNPSATAPAGGGLGSILGGLFGGNPTAPAPAGGGLGGVLGGLLGGAATGSVLSGGLGNILQDLQNAGKGQAAQSWVGTGANETITPDDLAHAIGPETIDALTAQTGLSRQELLSGLSENLPHLVDQLTPEGRLPTEHESARW